MRRNLRIHRSDRELFPAPPVAPVEMMEFVSEPSTASQTIPIRRTPPYLLLRIMGREFGHEDTILGTPAQILRQLQDADSGMRENPISEKADYLSQMATRCRIYNGSGIRTGEGLLNFFRDMIRFGFFELLAIDGQETAEGYAYRMLSSCRETTPMSSGRGMLVAIDPDAFDEIDGGEGMSF